MANDLHQGHRKRLKARFLTEGLDNFDHHNILEMLLFFSIPRMDTNEIAHNLITQFGSISEVFDAPFEELIKVENISENTATLIKLIPNLARVYLDNKQPSNFAMDSYDKLGKYFTTKFIGKTEEFVYLLCLDSSLNIISCNVIAHGTVSHATLSIRKIVEVVLKYNACSVALAHNHPRGMPNPSNEDIITTLSIKKALKLLDIDLIDHIIVAQNSFTSLAEKGYIN